MSQKFRMRHQGTGGCTSLIASRTAVSGKVVRPLTTAAMTLWGVEDQTLQQSLRCLPANAQSASSLGRPKPHPGVAAA